MTARVYTGDGKHRNVAINAETMPILKQCVKHDGVYYAVWNSAREICLRNEEVA